MSPGGHVSPVGIIPLLIIPLFTIVFHPGPPTALGASIPTSQDTRNQLKDKTKFVNLNQTKWRECHGYPSDMCRHIRTKMTELATLLEQKSKVDGKNGFTFTNVTLKEEEEEGEEVVYLTPEQIQYFSDALKGGRKKRKVEQFNQFVTKWPLPIQYTFDGSHGNVDRQKIKDAIKHWEHQTCLRFKEISGDDPKRSAEHRIVFMKYRGCGSYIGRVNILPQPVDLASKCLKRFGIIAHEIGHVIGFWHEHQRSDRDSYININVNNAISGLSFVTELMRLGRTANLVPYDYGSVLHYSAKTMSINGGYTIQTKDPLYQMTIGQRTGLSFLDAKLANLVYCKDSCKVKLNRPCENSGYQDPNVCTRCRCPDGFGGNFCDTLAPPVNAVCGGTLSARPTPRYIASPGYGHSYYGDHVQCNWHLKAPPGHRVELHFIDKFDVFCIDSTCFHWVEVRYDTDLTRIGPRFCCRTLPTAVLRSAGEEMLVLFRSNYTSYRPVTAGWRANFYSVARPNVSNTGDSPQNSLGRMVFVTPSTGGNSLPKNSGSTYPPRRHTSSNYSPENPSGRTSDGRSLTPGGATRPPTTPPWSYGCAPLDIAFIIDSSGSIGFENWLRALQFVCDIVKDLSVGPGSNRIGTVSFGSSASLHFNLLDRATQYDVIEAIRVIPWKDEMTNTSGGIRMAQESIFSTTRGDRPGVANVAVLLTDGESNRDSELTIPSAVAAKDAGTTLVVLGVGPGIKYEEVKAMASEPFNRFLFLADHFSDMDKLRGPVLNALCSVAARPPPPLPTRGWSSSRRSTTPATRFSTTVTPYGTNPAGPVCANPGYADVTFVLDSSGSIGETNWRQVLNFLKSVVGSLDLTSGIHRVGVVSFGTYAISEFRLDTYQSNHHLIQAIDAIPWRDEMTNTSGGLRVMRQMFDAKYGDRPGVPDIGVVITDGESNRDPYLVQPEAERARQVGIVLFVVGIGDKLNMGELRDIANKPSDKFIFHTRDFNDLMDVKVRILNGICRLTSNIQYPSYSSTPLTSYTTYPTHFSSPYYGSQPTSTPPTGASQTSWGVSSSVSWWSPVNPTTVRQTDPGTSTTYWSSRSFWSSLPTWSSWSPWSRSTTAASSFYPSGTGSRRSTVTSYRPQPSGGPCRIHAGDIAFILDSSGSVGANNWPKVLNFTKTLVKMLPIGPGDFQVGVITFGNAATIELDLDDCLEADKLVVAIDHVRWKDEWTNTSGGLRIMRTQLFTAQYGARPNVPKFGILVTDGESNKDKYRTIPEARIVHRMGVTMFAIGVGPNVDMNELEAIASNPLTTFLIHTPTFRNLWALARDVVDKLCHISEPDTVPTVSNTPPTVDPDTGPRTYSDCFPMELAVVLDSSSSVGATNWRSLIQFVASLVKELPIGPSRVRVAVVTFGNTGTLNFNLQQYHTLAGVLDGLDQVRWKNEWTNTSGGILVMRSQVFAHAEADRYAVPRVGLLFTDGRSNVDQHLTIPEADVARQQRVEMFAVGITPQASVDEVRAIADLPASRHAFFAQDFVDLYRLKVTLLNAICHSIREHRENRLTAGPGAIPPPPAPKPSSTTVSPEESPWGSWTPCSRLCGGCGRRWRYRQCTDRRRRTKDCGVPEEGECNVRVCTDNDICKFYVAYREYNRPCQKCCYGYKLKDNICVPT